MENNQLQKNLGLGAALSTLIGGVIGSGVFFKPQAIYTATGGAPGLGMLGWIVAALITIAAGLTVAELAVVIPKTGGMMMYIEEVYGKKIGFLSGWVQALLFYPGMIAALAVIFSEQFAVLSGMAALKVPLAIVLILLVAFLNSMGSKSGSIIQNISTICKLAVLVGLIILGFVLGEGNNTVITPMTGEGVNVASAFGQILLAIFFAFDGWMNVTALAGEMKNPGKDLPRAIVGGISVVAAVYLIINVSYLWVAPASELANSVSPASLVATRILGPAGAKVIGVGIMVSVFGATNAYLFTGSRVLYALAQSKHLPLSEKIGSLNKNQSPAFALLVLSLIAAVYALSGQFNLLTDLAMFSVWIFIVLSFLAVIKLRKTQPNLERSYKVPLYPIIPLVAIASGLFVLGSQLFNAPLLACGSIAIMLLGLPVYSIYEKKLSK